MADEQSRIGLTVEVDLDRESVRNLQNELASGIRTVQSGKSIKEEDFSGIQQAAFQLQYEQQKLQQSLQERAQQIGVAERTIKSLEDQINRLKRDDPGREHARDLLQEERINLRELTKEQTAGRKHLDDLVSLHKRFTSNEPRFEAAVAKGSAEGYEKALRKVFGIAAGQGMAMTGGAFGPFGGMALNNNFIDGILEGVSKSKWVSAIAIGAIAAGGIKAASTVLVGRATRAQLPAQFMMPGMAGMMERAALGGEFMEGSGLGGDQDFTSIAQRAATINAFAVRGALRNIARGGVLSDINLNRSGEFFGRAAASMGLSAEALIQPTLTAGMGFRQGRFDIQNMVGAVNANAPNEGLRQDLLWAMTEQIEVGKRKMGSYALSEKVFVDQNAKLLTALGETGLPQGGVPYMAQNMASLAEGLTSPSLRNLTLMHQFLRPGQSMTQQSLRQLELQTANPNWVYGEGMIEAMRELHRIAKETGEPPSALIAARFGNSEFGQALSRVYRGMTPDIRERLLTEWDRASNLSPEEQAKERARISDEIKKIDETKLGTEAAKFVSAINAAEASVLKTLKGTSNALTEAGDYLAESGRKAGKALLDAAEALGIKTKPTSVGNFVTGKSLIESDPEFEAGARTKFGPPEIPSTTNKRRERIGESLRSAYHPSVTIGMPPDMFQQSFQALVATESVGGRFPEGDFREGVPTTFGVGHMMPSTASDILGVPISAEDLKDPIWGPMITQAAWAKMVEKHGGDVRAAYAEWQGGPRAAAAYKRTGLPPTPIGRLGLENFTKNFTKARTGSMSKAVIEAATVKTDVGEPVLSGSSQNVQSDPWPTSDAAMASKVFVHNNFIHVPEHVPIDATRAGNFTYNVINS